MAELVDAELAAAEAKLAALNEQIVALESGALPPLQRGSPPRACCGTCRYAFYRMCMAALAWWIALMQALPEARLPLVTFLRRCARCVRRLPRRPRKQMLPARAETRCARAQRHPPPLPPLSLWCCGDVCAR